MRQVKVKTFLEFVQETTDETDNIDFLLSSNMLFRGQGIEGNLIPSIARKDPARDTTEKERDALMQLRLQGAAMIEGDPTDLELMVRAQHYGLKTRLLDWTSNPLVALYFACISRSNPNGDVFVYGLDADNQLDRDVYDKDPFATTATKAFQPRLNNARVIAQQGWFTLHCYAAKNQRFVSLEKNTAIKRHLHEYRVAGGKRKGILASLDRMGVNAKSIYADFSGLCQHINETLKL